MDPCGPLWPLDTAGLVTEIEASASGSATGVLTTMNQLIKSVLSALLERHFNRGRALAERVERKERAVAN